MGWSVFLWLQLGKRLAAHGVANMADLCFRQASAQRGPAAVEAGFLLAKSLLERDRNQEVVALLEPALATFPGHARAWCALGAARRRLADLPGARDALEHALALDPHYAQARCNLGEWWLIRGQPAAALAEFDRALSDDPDLLEAVNNRVAALYELARHDEAEQAARQALRRFPLAAALHVNLGTVLLHNGKARQAAKVFRQALEIDPARPEALLNLAMLFGETQQLGEAVAFVEREIAVKGESAQRLAALALAQQAKGDLTEAETSCRKLLSLQPANVSALITLSCCLSGRGDYRGAIAACEEALRANPNLPAIYSNIAFAATYLPDADPDEIFAIHRRWAEYFEVPRQNQRYRHADGGDPAKRLRIGYVSGDFGRHPVGFLIRDILERHDRGHFEIHAFSMMRKDDELTVAIRDRVDVWHDVLFDSDEEVAAKINAAGIDILVDLSGHTAYNRLVAFALRPAPVQASWIGYFHSTGLTGIDYFITDPFTSPRDGRQRFSETPVWLPHSRFCYGPPDYAPLPEPPPCHSRGYPTFGSFNRTDKLNPPVIAAWADILHAVPDSRLLLKAATLDMPGVADAVRERFAHHGIDERRLELRGRSGHAEMLAEYADVDIALDPFPFNGGMTTLEALWMGVPVVTVAGDRIVSRQTVALLANLGLADLAFADVDAYVRGAAALAGDPQRLERLRCELRPKLAASPVMDPERFTRDLEDLYRRMWQARCVGRRLPADVIGEAGGGELSLEQVGASAPIA